MPDGAEIHFAFAWSPIDATGAAQAAAITGCPGHRPREESAVNFVAFYSMRGSSPKARLQPQCSRLFMIGANKQEGSRRRADTEGKTTKPLHEMHRPSHEPASDTAFLSCCSQAHGRYTLDPGLHWHSSSIPQEVHVRTSRSPRKRIWGPGLNGRADSRGRL